MAGWTQRRRGMHPSTELMDRSWSYSDLNQIHSDDPGSQKSSLAGWQVYSADVYSLTSSGFTCCTHLKKDAAASHFPPLPFIFLHVNILGDAEVDLFKVEGKTVQENSFFLYSSLHFCPLKSPLCVFLQSSSLFRFSTVQLYLPRPPSLVTFPPPIILFSGFTTKRYVSCQRCINVIKCPLGHLCGV